MYRAHAYANALAPIILNVGNILYVLIALTGGILPKITNALAAVKAGVGAVRIAKYDLKNPGTLIQ